MNNFCLPALPATFGSLLSAKNGLYGGTVSSHPPRCSLNDHHLSARLPRQNRPSPDNLPIHRRDQNRSSWILAPSFYQICLRHNNDQPVRSSSRDANDTYRHQPMAKYHRFFSDGRH